jgi:SNARE protein
MAPTVSTAGIARELKSGPDKGKMSDKSQQVIVEASQVQDANARSLAASRHLVAVMIETGASTSAALKRQTEQMDSVNGGLTEVDSDLRAADRQIRVFARRIATDRCIMIMLVFIALGVIGLILVLKLKK